MEANKVNWDMYEVHSIFGDVSLGGFHGPSVGDIAILTVNKKLRFDVNIDAIDGENFLGTVLTISDGIVPAFSAEGLQRGYKVNFVHKNVCTFERKAAVSPDTKDPGN